MWNSHTIRYLAVKRNDVQLHTTVWMSLENKSDKRVHIYEILKISKSIISGHWDRGGEGGWNGVWV